MKRLLIAAALVLPLIAGVQIVTAQDKPPATAPAPTAAPASGINGKWQFMLDTPGGERDADANLTVDADGKITGTWDKATAAGTFKDGQLNLSFEYTSEESGDTATMKIVGKLDDAGSISGTWQFSSYDGSFKAIRPKS